MRLTDEVLRASDDSTLELVGNSLALAAAGRFGLLPATPFDLSVNFSKGLVDVVSLNCTAVTKGGNMIDVHYNTEYTNSFETRIQIPEGNDEKEYVLTINYTGQWKDSNDGYEKPVYTFSLMPPNSAIPSNSFPIARIVNKYDWHLDDIDFVPPCLFVSSHQKYIELLKRFSEILSEIDNKAKNLLHSNGKDIIRAFWPMVQQLMITVNKEKDLMTPMGLLANVQKCVSAFTCICELDDYINLADADKFRSYIYVPYNYKDSYQRIREGLELCSSINEKISKLHENSQIPPTIEAPTIANSQLIKKCTNSTARVQVTNSVSGATIYYSIDGSEPSQILSGQTIQLESGFNNSRKREPDKVVMVKVKAVLNGISSHTNSYAITMQKDIERWSGWIV